MKELTEQLEYKMSKVIQKGYGMCIYLVPDQAKHILSLLSKDQPVVGAEETSEQIVFFLKNNDLSISNQEQWVNDRLQGFASQVAAKMAREKMGKLINEMEKIKCDVTEYPDRAYNVAVAQCVDIVKRNFKNSKTNLKQNR